MYVTLRVIVVLTMIAECFNHNWHNVFMCVLTLILFLIPTFVERKFHIEMPSVLEMIIVLFIFAAEILGEIHEYYLILEYWDTMLHTTNGFIMAAIGFSLVDILNKNDKISLTLTPSFMAVFAFCFSMTTGIMWEFFEYFMDIVFHTDMQKDTIIHSISSIIFNPTGANKAVTMAIDEVIVNGKTWNYGGYIDIGLMDTMADMFVNFIGAVVFSIIGWIYIKNPSKDSIAEKFIPKMESQAEDKQLEKNE